MAGRPTKHALAKRSFQPLVAQLVKLLILEPPRTDNCGKRSKINIKMRLGEPLFKGFPRHVSIPCEDEGYEIKQWRAFLVLDKLHSLGYSDWSSKDIIRRRQGVLMGMTKLEEDIDNCFITL